MEGAEGSEGAAGSAMGKGNGSTGRISRRLAGGSGSASRSVCMVVAFRFVGGFAPASVFRTVRVDSNTAWSDSAQPDVALADMAIRSRRVRRVARKRENNICIIFAMCTACAYDRRGPVQLRRAMPPVAWADVKSMCAAR
jgi:hypothetical protein